MEPAGADYVVKRQTMDQASRCSAVAPNRHQARDQSGTHLGVASVEISAREEGESSFAWRAGAFMCSGNALPLAHSVQSVH
jgi:hypothetical protein